MLLCYSQYDDTDGPAPRPGPWLGQGPARAFEITAWPGAVPTGRMLNSSQNPPSKRSMPLPPASSVGDAEAEARCFLGTSSSPDELSESDDSEKDHIASQIVTSP